MRKTAAYLALTFGSFLAVAEAVRNWGNWQWWPFWLVDYIAAGLLIWGAVLVLQRARRGSVVLSGAWGFTTAMFYMSFWSHLENFDRVADGNLDQTPLTAIIGLLWVLTIVGFAISLRSPPALPSPLSVDSTDE